MKTQSINPMLSLFNPHAEFIARNNSGFTDKALTLFETAISLANRGLVYSALDTARDAIVMCRYTNEYIAPYVHGLVAQLLFETGRPGAACFHAEQALRALRTDHPDYQEDRKYYHSLLSAIRQAA